MAKGKPRKPAPVGNRAKKAERTGDNYRDILVCVVGSTPQVITETLYYLTQERQPPIVPEEIYALTTTMGRKGIEEKLLDPKNGKFRAFLRDYGIGSEKIKFGKANILVPRNSRGKELDDIRTAEDNEIAANFIFDFISEKTADLTQRLHCSLAGGRKTMSSHMATVMTLCGRPQDILSHVLIRPETFEGHPEFFYPTSKSVLLLNKQTGKEDLDAQKAEVEVAEIPFIRLREKVGELFTPGLKGKKKAPSYSDMVSLTQGAVDSIPVIKPLVLDRKNHILWIGEESLKLPPAQFVVYLHYVRNKLDRCPHQGNICRDGSNSELKTPYCSVCYTEIADTLAEKSMEEINQDYQLIWDQLKESVLTVKDAKSKLREYISKNNASLERMLKSDLLGMLYRIESVGIHGKKCYGIRLDRRKMKII
jgi:CRISPR-associated protein (TIGR02584 family)